MTFGDLKTIFANLYEQTGAPTTDVEVRNRFINLAAQNITRRRDWSWSRKFSTKTANGSSSLTVDSDIRHFVKDTFKVGDVVYTEINQAEKDFVTDDSQVFYLAGNNRDGFKVYFPCSVPDSGSSIEYWYHREHPTMTLDADICLVPDGECVCNLAVGKFLKSEGESDEALTFIEDSENGVDDMILEDKRNTPTRRAKKRQSNYHNIENCY